MKALKNLMEKTKPKKKGFLYWVWDSQYTFLFTPGHTTKSGAHIRDAVDLKRTMFTVIIALIPCLLFGIWNTGHQHFLATGQVSPDDALMAEFGGKVLFGLIKVLPMVVVSYVVGLGAEFVFCTVKGHAINEGYLVSGLLIPLIMPVDVPLWMVAIAVIFAVVIGKEVFGGTGMNILNVALTARAFLFFAYPTKMSGNEVWISTGGEQTVDGFTGATALGDLASFTGDEPVFSNIGEFANHYTLSDSFFGLIPGSIGETSALAILIGALILLASGVGSWRIMVSFFLGGLSMGAIFNAVGINPFMELDPIHQLMLGGFMFGMVFMATDPVTAAQTNTGKFIYGFLGGFLAIMIRVFNPAYPEGVMMAILFMNVMAPLIDHYVVQANINKRLKRMKVKTA